MDSFGSGESIINVKLYASKCASGTDADSISLFLN